LKKYVKKYEMRSLAISPPVLVKEQKELLSCVVVTPGRLEVV
jgi:hypothetical protein